MRSPIRLILIAIVLTGVAGGLDAEATRSSREIVLKWNRVLQNTLAPPGNPLTPRLYAMMHIAMFDAVNAIERTFEPYRVRLQRGTGGSPEAAAAQAAHDVLVALNPAATATYDAALAQDLGRRPSQFVRRDARLGAHVATAVLAWRDHDGWDVRQAPPYGEPPLPGPWQPTPPANAPGRVPPISQQALTKGPPLCPKEFSVHNGSPSLKRPRYVRLCSTQ